MTLWGVRALAFAVAVARAAGAAGGAGGDTRETPVTKVTNLIKELQTKTENDAKVEEKLYNRYACWCEDMTLEKGKAIHSALALLKKRATTILELKGYVAVRASEITALNKRLNEIRTSRDAASAIRNKESQSYLDKKTEFEQTLAALEKGIKALVGGGGGRKAPAAAAAALLKRAEVVRPEHGASKQTLALLRSMAGGTMDPKGGEILGILKDMYDSFTRDLEKATTTEATQIKNYETYLAVQAKEEATLKEERSRKEDEKAASEGDLAAATAEYDEVTVQMQTDTKLFDEVKESCTTTAAAYAERVRARSEELAGIAKALEILTGDEARALFGKVVHTGKDGSEDAPSFLQVAHSRKDSRRLAWEALSATARKTHSLRVAAVAASLRLVKEEPAGEPEAPVGQFDAVIQEIDKLIANLRKEEKEDIEQRDFCKAEIFKNEQEASRYEYKIQKLEGKIDKLGAKLEEVEDAIAEVESEMRNTRGDLRKMEDMRKEDHQAWQSESADNKLALELLGKAKEALGAYHSNRDEDPQDALLQRGGAGRAGGGGGKALPGEPAVPFSSAGGTRTESKGIVGLMELIMEDLQTELSDGTRTEREAQAAHEKEVGEAHGLLGDLGERKEHLEETKTGLNSDIDDRTAEKEDNQGLLDEEMEYLWSIKPDCFWMFDNYQPRRDQREAEMEGLFEAKGLLMAAEQSQAAAIHEETGAEAAVEGEAPAASGASASLLSRKSALRAVAGRK